MVSTNTRSSWPGYSSRAEYQGAIGLDPRFRAALYNIAIDWLLQIHPRGAVRLFSKALRLHPMVVWVLNTVCQTAPGFRSCNHACESNCRPVVEEGRVYIVAARDIRPGEELSFDYACAREGGPDERHPERYACRCGSRRCRGTLLSPRRGRKG